MLRILMLMGADLESLMIHIGMGKIPFLLTTTLIVHPNTTSMKHLLKEISVALGLTQAMAQLLQMPKHPPLQNDRLPISRVPVTLTGLNPLHLHRATVF
jgi:hypothetical protein